MTTKMDFITHLFENKRQTKQMSTKKHHKTQWTLFSGSHHIWASIHTLLLSLIISTIFTTNSYAEGIRSTKNEARITSTGQLAISTRFDIQLPEQLAAILQQGVPLDFALSYQLERPTFASYKFKINQLVNNENIVNYRLSYHPLTNRYRVTVGTFSSEYNSLNTALKAIGAILDWTVLSTGTLSDSTPEDTKALVRLNLTASKLPKPFQINIINSKNWDLDSGWLELHIKP